jgi:hypothetical protein
MEQGYEWGVRRTKQLFGNAENDQGTRYEDGVKEQPIDQRSRVSWS